MTAVQRARWRLHDSAGQEKAINSNFLPRILTV